MKTLLFMVLLFVIVACSKDKCNTDIKGIYNIVGSDPNSFYVIIAEDYYVIDANTSDTISQIEYSINCEEMCFSGVCGGYEFENGKLTTEFSLDLIKR